MKSCSNCQHGKCTHYPATREEPADLDFTCAHESDIDPDLFDASSEMSFDEAFEYVGERCPHHTDIIVSCLCCKIELGPERLVERRFWVSEYFTGDPVAVCDNCRDGFKKSQAEMEKNCDELWSL